MTKTRQTWTADFLCVTDNSSYCSGWFCASAMSVCLRWCYRLCITAVYVCSLSTPTCTCSCLPQVGHSRLAAVKRAEESGGWCSVMDNDSQQACGRAQPQALDSSPGEAEEILALEKRKQVPAWVEGASGS